ncbi:MAG: hypothetical protein IJO52_02220, partial [Clostridia bacterium]|nr:hypothetical protein [Clostridia bacterium]
NFENGADGWQLFKVGEEYATLTASEERGNVLRLADDEHRDPWAMQFVKNLSSGAVYRVTADLKAVSLEGSARFKTEFYSDNIHSADTGVSQADMPDFDVQANGEWQSVYFDVKVPFGANCLCLYARLYGTGEIYYDNIKMHMIRQAPILCVTSDAFVYTEWESAFVKASFYDPSYHIAENSSIVFSLLDEERLLDTKRTPAKNENHYVFPTSLLAEKQKKYIVRVEYISSDGKVIDSFDEPLYRYDRPSRLTKDGRFINENGEKILISFGYHASNSHFEDCAEIGINAIQLNAAANTLEYTAKQLDKLHKIGIYAFLELYGGMKPSAHPRNIQHTMEVVRAFKDHPAVMGYMIMDEPFLNDPNCYEVLRDSYKLFRDMDPDKPVYIVECERRWLYKTVTVCDILAIDPYPTGAKPYRTHVSDFSRTADIVNTHGKPVMNILQAYKLGGWEPDAQAMRHMAYQAFFAGNSSVGYYPVSDEGGLLYGNAKSNPDFLYQGVKYFMQHEYSD